MSDSLFNSNEDLNNSFSSISFFLYFLERLSPSPTSANLKNFSKLLEDADQFKLIFKEGLQDTQQDLIEQMKEETQFFNIGQQQYPFNSQDLIFTRQSKVLENERLESPYCLSCKLKLKSSKHHFCDFCGQEQCNKCLSKTKPFPMNNDGYKNRGEICKVCDRKFLIREMLKESLEQIDTQTQVTESLKQQAKEKKDECEECEREFKEYANNIEEQLNRCNQVKKDQKKQIKKLKNEIISIENENNQLFEKKTQMEADHQENKQNIDELKQSINDIDENVLRVKVKIRETELERERIEEQIQLYGQIFRQQQKKKKHSQSVVENPKSVKSSTNKRRGSDFIENSLFSNSGDKEIEGYTNFNDILQTEDISHVRSNRSTSQLSEYKKRKGQGEDSISTLQGPQSSCCNNSKCQIF